MTTREKKMSPTSALLARSLPRPSPRQARRMRRLLREAQPEVHVQLKALRREQRQNKREQVVAHVDHARKVWAGVCLAKGLHLYGSGNVDVRQFPGAFTPSPRRSRKWFKHFLRRSRGSTRTLSHKLRFKRWEPTWHPLHQCRSVSMSPRTGCYAQVRAKERNRD